MKTLSIKTYLTRLIWLCMGPLVLLAAYLSISNVLDRQAERDLEAANLAKSFATMIDQHLNARISALHMLAESSLVDDPSRWKDLYREAQGFHQGFGSHVVFADLNMRMLFNTRVPFGSELPLLPRPKGHSAVSAVLETGRPAIGDSFFGPIAKEPLVAIAVPARREGKVAFLLLTIFETRQFQALLDQVALPESWALTLLDGKQEGLARRAASGSNATTDVDAAGRFEVKLIASPWSVLLEIPRNVYRKPLIQSAFILVEVLLCVTLVSLLGGHWFGRRLARVVASLAEVSPPVAVKPAIAEIEAAGAMLHEAAAAKASSEKEVRKSEERFRIAQEMSPDGFTILRPLRGENGEIVDFAWVYENQTIARMNGTDPQAVIGKRLLDLFPTHQGTLVLEAYVRAANTGTRQIIEEVCVGEIVSTPAWLRLVVVSMGEDIAVLAQDITERKRTEAELRKSEALYRSLFQSNPHPMWVYDLETLLFLAVNAAAVSHYGFSRDEFLSMTIKDIRPPEDLPRLYRNLEELPAEGVDNAGVWRHLKKDGSLIDVEITSHVLEFDGRKSELVLAHDITARRQAESALRQSNERLEKVLQVETVGVMFWDLTTGCMTDANDTFLNMMGYSRADVESRSLTWQKLTPQEYVEVSLAEIRKFQKTGRVGPYEKEYLRKDGTRQWMLFAGSSLGGDACVEFCVDISDRMKAAAELRESEERFRRAVTGAPFPIMIHAEDGQVITINTPWTRLTGYGPSDIPTIADWTRKAYGTQMDLVRADIDSLYALDGPKAEGEYAITTSSGDSRIWDFSSAPIGRMPDGRRLVISMAMDVTERKQFEIERQKFFLLAESSSEFIGMCDLDMNPLYVNPAGRRMVGLPDMAAACRVKVQDYYFPEDRRFIAEEFFPRVLREGHGDVEIRLRHFQTGEPIWMFYYLFSVHDANGTPMGWATVSRDITERKRAEAALAEKENRYRDLVENSNDLICTHDLNGDILSVNPAAVKALGYPAAELLRMNLRDIISPEKRDRLAVYLHRLRRRGHARGMMFVRTSAGEERIWDYDNTLRTEGVPAPVVRGMARDVTEQKQAEEQLARSEEEFRRLSQEFHGLLDAIPDSLTLVDADLKVLWANRAAVETVGMTMEAVAGRHCFELWHNRSSACDLCPVERTFTTGQPQSETVTMPEGNIWDIRTVPLVDAQGGTTRVIEVKRDITEHRRLEEHLRQAQKLEGVGQLAGGIAHDFNNVLGVVMGLAGVLQMKMPEGDRLRHYTDELVAAAERGANLTRQILAFSRKQVFDLKPARLNGIILGLEKMLRRLLPESIDISFDLHKEDPVVLVDTGQIEQVLMNLATNARDAITGIGKIGIATGRFTMDRNFTEAHGYGEPGEYALIAVSDTGHGMDTATQARIFEPFFTTKAPGKGTGLGLAVVYGIIKQHRGVVNVYSEVGKGTVVRIYLPLAAGASPAATPTKPEARIAGGSETVLVAEDDEILRKISRTVLGQHGYTVIEAVDGEDAVVKFAANQAAIRLVILDGIMPKKGGVEALEEIRRLCPGIKAVFMSGYADDIFARGGLGDKGAAFIQKPVMPTDLLRKVREVLDA